jgi:hypothetical protein
LVRAQARALEPAQVLALLRGLESARVSARVSALASALALAQVRD